MAVTKTTIDSRLVLRVETGEMKGDKPVIASHSYSQIKKDAADDALYAAGNAIAGLQTKVLSSIRRVDTFDLVENA